MCKRFQVALDTSPYFYPTNVQYVDDPLSSIDSFSKDILFISKNAEDRGRLHFQFSIMRDKLIDLVNEVRLKRKCR